mmetsp:Transcript_68437/g.135230  ORF Transcript_68437/g.135230 Transcript_68437/m.135230 type:complete len:543 (-) Transcript_68437:79-1707(-)
MAGFLADPGIMQTSDPLLMAVQAQYASQAALRVSAQQQATAGSLGQSTMQQPLGLKSDGTGTSSPSQPTRMQKMKEERAKKVADAQAEAERQRCHLHKKIKDGCKFCQRHKDFVSRKEEDRAALRDKFISDVRRQSKGEGRPDDLGRERKKLDLASSKTFGFPPLLQSHIVESTHFKTLMALEQFEEITEEIANFADTIEPYMQNSTTVPSALFICVYRLLSMGIDAQQLRRLIEGGDNSYIRCAGFLFIRFGLAPDQLWFWLGEYVLDDDELPAKDVEKNMSIGEYVECLMTQDRYYSTVLPRLPASTKRQLEVHLAGVPQCRKRAQANLRLLDVYSQKGLRIEALLEDGGWHAGESVGLADSAQSRHKLRVRIDGSERETTVHLGRVILADDRHGPPGGLNRPRSRRSRSRSPVDWTRDKGRSNAELLEELRKREQDRAVCSSKSDYARRPVSFKVALPMEQGSASHRLIQDETSVASTKRADFRDRSRSPLQARGKEHSVEYQARMRQLFEKYGMAKGSEVDASRRRSDLEVPDVMRLG